jgi:hypothetical protein
MNEPKDFVRQLLDLCERANTAMMGDTKHDDGDLEDDWIADYEAIKDEAQCAAGIHLYSTNWEDGNAHDYCPFCGHEPGTEKESTIPIGWTALEKRLLQLFFGADYRNETLDTVRALAAIETDQAESIKAVCPFADAVAKRIEMRAQKGLEKYGVTCERSDLDLHQWMTHLQEELMDAAVYIERTKYELWREKEDFK